MRLPSLSTRSAFALLILLIGLLPAGLLLLAQTRVAISNSIDLVIHTNEVLLATKQVDLDIEQAEMGLRGYLITRESNRLEFFRTNMAEAYRSLAELGGLITDNANQVRRVGDLKALLDRRFTLMQDAAARVASAGPSASIDMLAQFGFRAEEAQDAETGLARLGQWPQIDVILVDLGLPGMSGSDLITELRRRHPLVRIIIASGQSRSGRLREGLSDDSIEVLEKPFMPRDLKDALDRTLHGDTPTRA